MSVLVEEWFLWLLWFVKIILETLICHVNKPNEMKEDLCCCVGPKIDLKPKQIIIILAPNMISVRRLTTTTTRKQPPFFYIICGQFNLLLLLLLLWLLFGLFWLLIIFGVDRLLVFNAIFYTFYLSTVLIYCHY